MEGSGAPFLCLGEVMWALLRAEEGKGVCERLGGGAEKRERLEQQVVFCNERWQCLCQVWQ